MLRIFFIVFLASQSYAHPKQCDNVSSTSVCLGKKFLKIQVSTDHLTCKVSEAPRPKVRDDYTLVPNVGYYKFHTEVKTWNEARKTCIAEGGHLAILNSKAEEQALVKIFKNKSEKINSNADENSVAFLGAQNLFDNNDWVTVLGDSLESTGFNGWNPGPNCYGAQPDNSGGNQHCAALFRDCGMMDDVRCDWKLAFICELADVCLE